MSNEWGKALKEFRGRTRLSQGNFSDAVSVLSMEQTDVEQELLSAIGIEHLVLANYELSRYENGRRMPRYRSRYVSLIWVLHKLDALQSLEEANDWLELADQSPLSAKEEATIFLSSQPAEIAKQDCVTDSRVADSRGNNLSNGSQSGTGTTVTQKSLFSSAIAKTIALAGAILFVAVGILVWQSGWVNLSMPNLREPNQSEPSASEELPTITEANNALSVATRPTTLQTSDSQPSDNLIANADFQSGMDSWRSLQRNGAAHTIAIENGMLCSDISSPGEFSWDLSIWFDGVYLEANTLYRLSFDVESQVERNISVMVKQSHPPDDGYFFSTQSIGPDKETVEINFLQNLSDPVARLSFWAGGQRVGEVCFDNVALTKQGTVTPNPAAFAETTQDPENLIPYADFSNGLMSGWWLHESDNAAMSLYVQDGMFCSNVNKPGSSIWSLTIGQHGLILEGDKEYHLSFEVHVAKPLDLRIGVGKEFDDTIALTPAQTSVALEFTQAVDDPNATIALKFGGQENAALCFDNFRLVDSSTMAR